MPDVWPEYRNAEAGNRATHSHWSRRPDPASADSRDVRTAQPGEADRFRAVQVCVQEPREFASRGGGSRRILTRQSTPTRSPSVLVKHQGTGGTAARRALR